MNILTAALILVVGLEAALAAPIETTATISAARDVAVAAKIVARVERVLADEGDRVAEGQPLVQLDDAEPSARLASAEAGVELARAELRRAARADARARALFANKTLSEEAFDAAVYAREAAEAQVAVAEARVSEARAALAETRLAAPFDGVVVSRQVEPGQLTRPGSTLLEIEDLGRLEVSFRVKDRDVPGLVEGAPVTVVVDALGQDGLTASIIRVIPSGDPETHEFRVEASLPAADGVLPGMFATVRIDR